MLRKAQLGHLQRACEINVMNAIKQSQKDMCGKALRQLGALHVTIMELTSGYDFDLTTCNPSMVAIWKSFRYLTKHLNLNVQGDYCDPHGTCHCGHLLRQLRPDIKCRREVRGLLCLECESEGESLFRWIVQALRSCTGIGTARAIIARSED